MFWPSNFNLEDTSSPHEIIESARQEWEKQSKGVLSLIIHETESANNTPLLIVYAKHVPSDRTKLVFTVGHRPESYYPARIHPKEEDLPNAFKKTYYKPGLGEMRVAMGIGGETITNQWVCDTPSEFRLKLKELFNLGTMKSAILNLVSMTSKGASQAEPEAQIAGSEEIPEGVHEAVHEETPYDT